MPSAAGPRGGLTGAALASLLGRLGADAETAGAAYERLRRTLVEYFTWRGAATPELCADDTLDRLAARLHEGVAVRDVPRFARGIARMVLLEHWRRPEAQATAIEGVDPAVEPPADPDDGRLHDCLDHCLGQLRPDGRELILEYYSAEGRSRIDSRKRMAARLGLTEGALRNRALRLRDQLEACVEACLGGRHDPGGTET